MIYDYGIIGGGIVGLAVAMAIARRQPGTGVILFEKESEVAFHQSGHNSGVIHAGIYYKPNSLKAELCRLGERATKEFCEKHEIPYATPGKLVVATTDDEHRRLNALKENAEINQIAVTQIDSDGLTDLEPNITGMGALHVHSSGIVDYRNVATAMLAEIKEGGADVILGLGVDRLNEDTDVVEIETANGAWKAKKVIACAGLQADRLIRRSGLKPDFCIIPFRGEYYTLADRKNAIITRMIYPTPDPELPFLGIHLTPTIDGGVHVGPNAVLAGARENYNKFAISFRDMRDTLAYSGFWKLMAAHVRYGLNEAKNTVFKQSYLAACRRYCPDLDLDDLIPDRAGIRAQAVRPNGEMIHDFHFVQTDRVLHVANAPSPAATSAIPIGAAIFEKMALRP